MGFFFSCRRGGQDAQTDVCRIVAPLGFIWGNVMSQVTAVSSSFSNEAAERTAEHEKNQRQRDRKEEEPRVLITSFISLKSRFIVRQGFTGRLCINVRVWWTGLKRRKGKFLAASFQLLKQHVPARSGRR